MASAGADPMDAIEPVVLTEETAEKDHAYHIIPPSQRPYAPVKRRLDTTDDSTSQESTPAKVLLSNCDSMDASQAEGDDEGFILVEHRRKRTTGIPVLFTPTQEERRLQQLNPLKLNDEVRAAAGAPFVRHRFTARGGLLVDVAEPATVNRLLKPFLCRRLRIHDTCGINNLHGMPGILAGIVSAVVAASATEEEYNYSLYTLYPARAPPVNSTDLEQIRFYTMAVHAGLGRSASSQGLFQLAALACTVAIAIGGGLFTGLIMKLKFFDAPSGDDLFDDETSWEIEEDEAATEATPAAPRPTSKGNQIAMIETQPESARARLPAHFNGAYDVSASPLTRLGIGAGLFITRIHIYK
ncbi:hypothetical protein HPB47_025993 [Ixodes persulcatus]|uniref:Uncharacterized protein n=1 Tax=Ixodes persulcatus TaxID=34615 RepID=A0AC60PZX8_IXOPE|nr:hypothetical protein HPB47_025993 [Ixodes persulcatus]